MSSCDWFNVKWTYQNLKWKFNFDIMFFKFNHRVRQQQTLRLFAHHHVKVCLSVKPVVALYKTFIGSVQPQPKIAHSHFNLSQWKRHNFDLQYLQRNFIRSCKQRFTLDEIVLPFQRAHSCPLTPNRLFVMRI